MLVVLKVVKTDTLEEKRNVFDNRKCAEDNEK